MTGFRTLVSYLTVSALFCEWALAVDGFRFSRPVVGCSKPDIMSVVQTVRETDARDPQTMIDVFTKRSLVVDTESTPHYLVFGPGNNYIEILYPLTDPESRVTIAEVGNNRELMEWLWQDHPEQIWQELLLSNRQLIEALQLEGPESLADLFRSRVQVTEEVDPQLRFDAILVRNPLPFGDLPSLANLRPGGTIWLRTENYADYLPDSYKDLPTFDLGERSDFGYIPPEVRNRFVVNFNNVDSAAGIGNYLIVSPR